MKNKREIGTKFEEIAKKFLEGKNLVFIESNYYTKYGEIDLIFLQKNPRTIVFVEVKYRKNNNYGEAIEMVSKRKQEKIIKSSQIYLIKNRWRDNVRYDIIGITGNNFVKNIDWIENAF